jgi:hypothetical protein
MGDPSDRFRDEGSPLHGWTEPEVLVVCPRCSSRAVVRRHAASGRRLTCPGCGLARETLGTTSTWGGPVDPWFGVPLWLKADFRGHTMWAFNAGHLKDLHDFVAAGLRERTPTNGAAMSMLEKLPDWMTSAKNRDEIVAALDWLTERAG